MHDQQFFIRRLKRPLAVAVLLGTMVAGLQGCMGLAVGGAVMGTLAATDRRTLGAQTEDKAIVVKGESRVRNLIGSGGHVNVTSFNRKVLLTGEVRDQQMKEAVAREVSAIQGVQGIFNELEIGGSSSLTARSSDTLVTGKVKASLVDAQDVYANSVKVTTERGIVYLMGRVSLRESKRAAEIAAGVPGVYKVVKLFELIDESELQKMSSTPQAANTR